MKVDTPSEMITKSPNNPRIAHTTANTFNVIAVEVWNKMYSPTHCIQRQMEALLSASPCGIIIRDGAQSKIQMRSVAVSQPRCAHQHCYYPEFCHL